MFRTRGSLAILAVLSTPALAQTPLTTAFTYQGYLADGGSPAGGSFDLVFTLFNDASPVSGPICADNVAVTDGRFTVLLDFGAAYLGTRRYLEIGVRADSTPGNCGIPGGYTLLTPRQELTATPHSLVAIDAKNSLLFNNQPASFYTNAANLTGTLADARLPGNVPRLSLGQTFTAANIFSNPSNVFVGDGSGVTNLNASNITSGTLAEARLPASLARLAGDQSFTGVNIFFNPGNGYYGDGVGLTNLNASRLATGQLPDLRLLGTYSNALTFSNAANMYHGGGQNLTSLNASNITLGVLASNRLPGNVLRTDLAATITADYRFAAVGVGAGASSNAQLYSSTTRTSALHGVTSSTAVDAAGVRGEATATSGTVHGGYFTTQSPSGAGVFGESDATEGVVGYSRAAFTPGVLGTNPSDTGYGVLGRSLTGTGAGYGVWGETIAPSGAGVYGVSNATTGASHGVWGVTANPSGRGVLAANPGINGVAFEALAFASTGTGLGILSRSNADSGVAVSGIAGSLTGSPIAIRGSATAPDGWAGYFSGRAHVSGVLGIGTASPTALLHARTTGGLGETLMRLDVDSTTMFFVGPAGKVGVGTANPAGRFNVNSDAGENPLRVEVDGATKLLVRDNGGLIIGGLAGPPPEDGLLVNRRIVVRDNDPNRQTDLWLGPDYEFEYAHLVVNGDGLQDLLALANQDSTKFRVGNDGSVSIGSNSVPPTEGLFVKGNALIGAGVFPLPPERLYVNGTAAVVGSLSKGGGSFKIDHPLDPENKYLYHSFVESPDMMNIYNGNIATDGDGFATVQLPEWFTALNRDFRYQLTVIDSGEDDFVFARVYRKLENNAFVIRTTRPGTEVSWQITGIRQDPWAEQNRIRVEVDKPAGERGRYLHPDVRGGNPKR